jgi:hypothetical protein
MAHPVFHLLLYYSISVPDTFLYFFLVENHFCVCRDLEKIQYQFELGIHLVHNGSIHLLFIRKNR